MRGTLGKGEKKIYRNMTVHAKVEKPSLWRTGSSTTICLKYCVQFYVTLVRDLAESKALTQWWFGLFTVLKKNLFFCVRCGFFLFYFVFSRV